MRILDSAAALFSATPYPELGPVFETCLGPGSYAVQCDPYALTAKVLMSNGAAAYFTGLDALEQAQAWRAAWPNVEHPYPRDVEVMRDFLNRKRSEPSDA